MLTAADIGPRNYTERAKSFSVIMMRTPPSQARPDGMVYIGRHTPEEYDEFEQCLADAANFPEKLEAAATKLVDIANLASVIEDFGAESRKRQVVGHGIHILGLLLMQAGVPISDTIRGVLLTQCAMDTQVIYSTWGPAAANRRALMRIWYSLLEQYDGTKAAIKYECESFGNTLARCNETQGEHRSWQEEANAIMARISVTQLSRTNIQPSIFRDNGEVDGHRVQVQAMVYRPDAIPAEAEQQEHIHELRRKNRALTEQIGNRAYTPDGSIKKTRAGVPKTAEELEEAGFTADMLIEPDEDAAKVMPMPDAVPAPESGIDSSSGIGTNSTASNSTASAATLGALITKLREHEPELVRKAIASHLQLPMTLGRVQAALVEDLAGFDAEKVCWHCASWTLFNHQVGLPEGCGRGVMPTVLSCSGCHQAYYCCRECQQKDWDSHRVTCRQHQRLAAKRTSSTGDALQAGDAVVVHGLKGAAQHNGKQGVVQRFDGDKDRFIVKLEGEKELAIKPENLRRAGLADR